MNLKAKFTEHPRAVGETYGEHFVQATGFSLTLMRAALACAVHAVLPFAFEKTASESIAALHDRMVGRISEGDAVDWNRDPARTDSSTTRPVRRFSRGIHTD